MSEEKKYKGVMLGGWKGESKYGKYIKSAALSAKDVDELIDFLSKNGEGCTIFISTAKEKKTDKHPDYYIKVVPPKE